MYLDCNSLMLILLKQFRQKLMQQFIVTLRHLHLISHKSYGFQDNQTREVLPYDFTQILYWKNFWVCPACVTQFKRESNVIIHKLKIWLH